MTKKPMPPIADLIAETPGAQTRQEAHAHIKARREQWRASEATPPGDVTQAEPMPPIDGEDIEPFAKGFWQRHMEKEKPKRGGKPQLTIVRNDKDDEPPPDEPA